MSSDLGEPPSRPRAVRRLLSSATLLIVLTFLARTSADADLWGHLAFGRDIVVAGAVHASDPYSFTSDRPWINHEWLAEAAMWVAYAAGGGTGLVALKLLLVALAGGLLLVSWRGAGLRPAARDALLFGTALGVWPQVATFRPQVFSIALFAALLVTLERVRTGDRRWLLALPALFALWVNLHGGWLVGAGVLAVFTACDLARPAASRGERAGMAGAAVAAATATLCNPYGAAMLGFLAETVRPGRADIVEWRPVTALPVVAMALWCVPLVAAAVVAWRAWRRRAADTRWLFGTIPAWSILVVLILAAGSFRIARLVSFFALAVAFLLVPHGAWRPASEHGTWGQTPSPLSPIRIAKAAMAGVALLTMAIALSGREVRIDGPWFPEPEAARFVHAHSLAGRMLTWFDYGEYAIWHFGPALRVSMDGRRETVYSQRARDLNFEAYGGGPDGLRAVKAIDPDYVWLPNTSAAVPTLISDGWRPLFRGSRSTILARTSRAPLVVAAAVAAPRAFPGP